MLPVLSATTLAPIALLAVGGDAVLDETLTPAKGTSERQGDHNLPPELTFTKSLKHSISDHYRYFQ